MRRESYAISHLQLDLAMEFRRSGQRDERRRRVLMDEQLASSDGRDDDAGVGIGSDGRPLQLYSEAALASHQPPLTYLIPKRVATLLGVLLCGGLLIASIEALYGRLFLNLPAGFRESLLPLNVAARGSLAAWFSSLTLFVAGLFALLVFHIRRHRLDDYRGRYRIWLWAALALLLASLDAATGLHAVFRPALAQLTGGFQEGDASFWGAVVLALPCGLFLLRLGFEIRSSYLATSFLSLSAAAYSVTLIMRAPNSPWQSATSSLVPLSTTLLAAHFCLFYSVILFCRHVYLEAHGLVKNRPTSVSKKKQQPTAQPAPQQARRKRSGNAQKKVRVDEAHQKPTSPPPEQPPRKKSRAPIVIEEPPGEGPTGEEDAGEDAGPTLSKAERRRLRKLQRRQKRKTTESEA